MRNVMEKIREFESHNPGKTALALSLLAAGLVIFFVWLITPQPSVAEIEAKIRQHCRCTLSGR